MCETRFTALGEDRRQHRCEDGWRDSLCGIVERLREIAERVEAHGSAFWFLFGSSTRSFSTAKDVDVLVVCDSEETADLARVELGDLCLRFPVHPMLLTRTEEAELRFVSGEGCIQVFPN